MVAYKYRCLIAFCGLQFEIVHMVRVSACSDGTLWHTSSVTVASFGSSPNFFTCVVTQSIARSISLIYKRNEEEHYWPKNTYYLGEPQKAHRSNRIPFHSTLLFASYLICISDLFYLKAWRSWKTGIVLWRVFGVWLSRAIATMALEQVGDSAGPADTGININIIWILDPQ